jgi:hypothetical protein
MNTPSYLQRESLYLKLWNTATLINIPELDRTIDLILDVSQYSGLRVCEVQ